MNGTITDRFNTEDIDLNQRIEMLEFALEWFNEENREEYVHGWN